MICSSHVRCPSPLYATKPGERTAYGGRNRVDQGPGPADLQKLIEAEATAHIGAEPGEHAETRTSWRNGHRDKVLTTQPLTGHPDQLHYDIALKKGWPIATGSVEGPAGT
jgi:hypothetical protein